MCDVAFGWFVAEAFAKQLYRSRIGGITLLGLLLCSCNSQCGTLCSTRYKFAELEELFVVLSVIFEWFTMRWNARLFFNRFCRPLLQEVVAVFHLVTVSLTEVSRAALFWLARLPQTFWL